MRFRSVLGVTIAVVMAAGVGIGGGYALGRHDRPAVALPPPPATTDSVAPMQALPELPIATDLPYEKDYDYPPLPSGLTFVPERVSGAGHVWQYRRPAGWKKYPGGPTDPVGTVRWRPADEAPEKDGFVLRLLPLQGRDTPKDMVSHQTDKMRENYRDVKVPNVTADSVWFTFRSPDNFHRYNYFAWVASPGSPYAGLEISVAGRIVDQDGLAQLLSTVQQSARQVR